LADPDKIDVGMKIKIPSGPVHVPPPTGEILHKHVVKQGDSLWKLAKAWNVPLKAVIDANPHLKNPNVLLTGDVVYIPNLSAQGGQGEPHTGGMTKEQLTAPMPQPAEAGPEVMQPPVMPQQQAVPEEPMEWTPLEGITETAEEVPQPLVLEQQETQFPFAQFHMPATEAAVPGYMQPPVMPDMMQMPGFKPDCPPEQAQTHAEHKTYFPTQPQMPHFPSAHGYGWSYESIQVEASSSMPPEGTGAYGNWMQPMTMPAMGDKYPGIPDSAAHCPGYGVPTPYMEQPGFMMPPMPQADVQGAYAQPQTGDVQGQGISAQDQPFDGMPDAYAQPFAHIHGMYGHMPMFGGPCHPCQQGYAPSLYGIPYAMPAAAYPEAYSPHAAWMKKEDCGCGGQLRTGDIGTGEELPEETETKAEIRKAKSAEPKTRVSTRSKPAKRKVTVQRRVKKESSPWIRA